MYRIPLLDKSFEDECAAREYLNCISFDYSDRLMDKMQKYIDTIPVEDRAQYRLAYFMILDALDYLDSGLQVGDMAAEEYLEGYIEEGDE